jgi:cyclic pyranopterin phosphate synthase
MTAGPARPQVSYMRVSITDRCNQRCVYCMPPEGVALKTHTAILSYEELARVIRCAVPLGVRSVRLTGGEPLVRRGIVDFAASVAAIPGVDDLALTTNGVLLADLARDLRRAGVRRVNVSLDSLRPDRYRRITRRDAFAAAWTGVEAALAAGLAPVKINTVVVRGLNDDEIEEMALAAAAGAQLIWRFIELMPLGEARGFGPDALVTADEIVGRLAAAAARRGLALTEDTQGQEPLGAGPARYFRLGAGRIGVISPMTHGFCSTCNRLRLTSDGRVHPCLTSSLEIDLAGPLRAGASDAELTRLLAWAVSLKPEAHRMRERRPELAERRMSRIGG